MSTPDVFVKYICPTVSLAHYEGAPAFYLLLAIGDALCGDRPYWGTWERLVSLPAMWERNWR